MSGSILTMTCTAVMVLMPAPGSTFTVTDARLYPSPEAHRPGFGARVYEARPTPGHPPGSVIGKISCPTRLTFIPDIPMPAKWSRP